MEKTYCVVGGWIAFNIMFAIALLNRRHAPQLRHRFARWVMSTPRARRRRSAHTLVTAAHSRH
jgi:hypothetical protein